MDGRRGLCGQDRVLTEVEIGHRHVQLFAKVRRVLCTRHAHRGSALKQAEDLDRLGELETRKRGDGECEESHHTDGYDDGDGDRRRLVHR